MPTEGVIDAYSPSHSLLSLNCGEDLGRVLESDWPFSQRVADGEEIDESDESLAKLGDAMIVSRTYKTTGPILEPRLVVGSSFKRDRPAARRKIHMPGNV